MKLIIVCAVMIGTSAVAVADDYYYNSVPGNGDDPSWLRQANESASRYNYEVDSAPVLKEDTLRIHTDSGVYDVDVKSLNPLLGQDDPIIPDSN